MILTKENPIISINLYPIFSPNQNSYNKKIISKSKSDFVTRKIEGQCDKKNIYYTKY